MINVIAGVNGAGQSSVLGQWIRALGGDYFNPDEVTRKLMMESPGLSLNDANIQSWNMNFDRLCQVVDLDQDYAFETTLGGNSIATELNRAIEQGVKVSVFYCGLASPELHIARVAARVTKGGHDIPEDKIQYRWASSIHNLMALIPGCHEITVFDNSADLVDGKPAPVLLFSLVEGVFASMPVQDMPDWAKPLAVEAMKRHWITSQIIL